MDQGSIQGDCNPPSPWAHHRAWDRMCGSQESVPVLLSSLCHQQCCVCVASSWSFSATNKEMLLCRPSLMLLLQMLGWLWWNRKTWEGSSVNSGKHDRNALTDSLPAKVGMPLLAHMGLVPQYRCGEGRAWSLLHPIFTLSEGAWWKACLQQQTLGSLQLCLDETAVFMLCSNGKYVSLCF